MAQCSFCGKKAGLFKTSHEVCHQVYQAGTEAVTHMIADAVFAGKGYSAVESEIHRTQSTSFINADKMRQLKKEGFDLGAERAATNKTVDIQTFEAVNKFGEDSGLLPDEIGQTRGFKLTLYGVILWGVVNGSPIDLGGDNMFNLSADEFKVICIGSTAYMKDSIMTRREGGYGGLSVPIGAGLRVNLGSFASKPVQQHYFKDIDSGQIMLTTKRLYFRGEHTAIKLPYRKLLSIEPYMDALGIFRDVANSRQEIFAIRDSQVPSPGVILHQLTEFLMSSKGQDLYY